MEQNINIQETDWLSLEVKELDNRNPMPEMRESLKLEEKKVYHIKVDISKPFESWKDPVGGATKKILPVLYEGKLMSFWLNVANPCYREIIMALKGGQLEFNIMRQGQAKATRYMLVK